MSSQRQSPLQFGDPRPTSHVSNHTTLGLASRGPSLDYIPSDARELLQNVKEDDDIVRKRSGALRAFGRRSPFSDSTHSQDINKHYVKMGILMSDDARVDPQSPRSSQSTAGASLRKTHTLPVLSPRGRSSVAERPLLTEEVLSEGACPVTRPRTNSSGFELIEAEMGGEEGAITQPSPPISVKSSSSSNNTLAGGGGDDSSPDSGYGNTPDYVNAARSEDKDKRERGSTNNSVFSVDSVSGSPRHGDGRVDRPLLRHANSVPVNPASGEAGLERGTTFPFQMSLATNRSTVDFGEMEERLQRSAHHHVTPVQPTPVQPTPHQKAKGQSNISSNAQRSRGNSGLRKSRAISQPNTAANAVSPRPLKAGTLPPTMSDTKDYFQVTDELAKENAHFALSEALLSVVEQYKANCVERLLEEPVSPASSPVVSNKPWKWSPGGLTPIGGAHYLGERLESPVGSPTRVPCSLGGEADGENTASPRRSRQLSLLELMESPSWDNSAESTAQRLLRHMTGHMTLTGLEKSQVVVQLPTEFLTSLQTDEDLQRSVTTSSAHIRGNSEWAPPRKQIIYSVKQPSRNVQKDLAAQGYRCTGCGMKVTPAYVKYFRFCHYTGKYFCQNCHTNSTSLIPAHILDRWSFKKLPVSNFARDLLAKIHSDALFTISSDNTFIYNKVSVMTQAKDIRAQLIAVKQYLHTCKNDTAQHLNRSFQGYAPWTTDLHTYSIEDFLEVKSGNKMKYLRAMLVDGVAHVKNCPLCMGKGFVCELCSDRNIIYPFECSKVNVCPECQCCFHKSCFPPSTPCPRCIRLNQRLRQRARFEESRQTLRPYTDRLS